MSNDMITCDSKVLVVRAPPKIRDMWMKCVGDPWFDFVTLGPPPPSPHEEGEDIEKELQKIIYHYLIDNYMHMSPFVQHHGRTFPS